MDLTALQQQVTADEAAVSAATEALTSAQANLDAANAALASDQAKLNDGTFINQIEALATAPDELATVISALEADGYTLTLTPPAAAITTGTTPDTLPE